MSTSSTDACFFWYPTGAPLRITGLGQELGELTPKQVREQATSRAISGRRSVITYNSAWQVRVQASLIVDQDVVTELETLENHLRRLGTVSVAEQGNRTLGAFLKVTPHRGDTSLHWYTQLYSAFGGAFSPTAGERLYLRGPSPRGLHEVVTATTGNTLGATLSTPIRHEWENEPWVFVHNQRFWPALQLQLGAINGEVLQGEHRVHYTLDLLLEESPDALARLAEYPEDPLLGELEQHGAPNLQDLFSPDTDRPRPPSRKERQTASLPTSRPGAGRWF